MAHWVAAKDGAVPDGAVQGGEDHGGALYVARARHGEDLVPGKLAPHYGKCFVPWGGQEQEKTEYEVLCGVSVEWKKAKEGKVSKRALAAGNTAGGETLYVGRAKHEESLHLGKVQPSHECCYISYGGQEIPYKKYEILVIKKD